MPTTGLEYGDLSTCSDEYKATADIRKTIEDFYVGGFAIQARAKDYLPMLVGEHAKRHADRCSSAGYINYFAQITDYFASALFSREIVVKPAADADSKTTPGNEPDDSDVYALFAKDADGTGMSGLNDVLQRLVVTALKQRRAWLHVELPAPPPMPAASLAEEDALGLGRPYVFELPQDQLIDWDYDDDGDLAYAVVHQSKKLKGPPGNRSGDILEEFKVWRKVERVAEPVDVLAGFEHDEADDDVGADVYWEKYEIQYPPNKPPQPHDIVPMVDSGRVSFRRIPILELAFPAGLWVGNKLAPLAREHYQRRTTLNAAENRSMVAIPVAKLGPEIGGIGGEMPGEAQQNPHRGNDPVGAFVAQGYKVIGAGDSIEFVEPSGNCYELVARRINELKEEMFRICHQLAASVGTSAGLTARSGKSKEEDRAAEAMVLTALGNIVRRFAVSLYSTISVARGEDIHWTAHGLDSFEPEDRADLILEASQMALVPIQSETFRKLYEFSIASKLVPNADPATLETIRDEISASVAEKSELDALQIDAKQEAAKQPPAPPPVFAS